MIAVDRNNLRILKDGEQWVVREYVPATNEWRERGRFETQTDAGTFYHDLIKESEQS